MAVADKASPHKQHIRAIRHHFLSRALHADPDLMPLRPRLQLRVTGSPGSPWALPLAANLALAAAGGGEAGLLVVPGELMPAAARLLGAAPGQLGPCFDEGVSVRALEPCAGLTLGPPFLLPLLLKQPQCAWIITLQPRGGSGRGPWLYLAAGPAAPFADPRLGGGEPDAGGREALFLLGLDHVPTARPGVSGVWGRIAATSLLDPGRPGWPRYLTAPAALRRQYDGFLTALRHLAGSRAGGAAGSVRP